MTFKCSENAINDLAMILGRVHMGDIRLEFDNPTLVSAIVQSGDWGCDQNRMIEARFPLGIALRDDKSIALLSWMNGLESIRIANQNSLNAMITGRQKRQQEVVEEITSQCLEDGIRLEVRSWGFVLDVGLDLSIKELPGIKFSISDGAQEIIQIMLDAWSGCILVNGKVQPVAYSSGKQVRKIIMDAVIDYVEKMTA
ncbi:MAG TPA: hypothetical protein DEA89_03615 [Candidatus Moranbacteria bacterium]|nr:hypothetical protein [Candidatus Moranbacteria bacterium]